MTKKKDVVRCDNCEWEGTEEQMYRPFGEIHHLSERLDPGSEIPVGECPECNCMCYYTDDRSVHVREHQWRDLANNAVKCLKTIRDGNDDSVWREVAEIIEDQYVLQQDETNGDPDAS